MQSKRISPLKAIRAKCLDCSCWQPKEVRLCVHEGCPLHHYRFGKNPNRKGIGSQKGFFLQEIIGSTTDFVI